MTERLAYPVAGAQPDRTDKITRHVLRVVLEARERGARDFRRVRMRRPNGWSREDFSAYHLVHQTRGDWTYVLERDGDAAVIVLGDRLVEAKDAGT